MLKHLYNHVINMYKHLDDMVQQIVQHQLHKLYFQTIINYIH